MSPEELAEAFKMLDYLKSLTPETLTAHPKLLKMKEELQAAMLMLLPDALKVIARLTAEQCDEYGLSLDERDRCIQRLKEMQQ